MKNRKRKVSTKLAGVLIVFAAIILAAGAWGYERQSNNTNSVRVDVTPVQLNSGKPVKFEIRLNTHSVDLNFDLSAVALLKDNQGHEYRPTGWNGSPPGGHHRKGVLEFPAIDSGTKSVTLYLRDIAGVSERTFEWKTE